MFNLYKDPEGENIFTGTHSSAAVPGIAAGATSILTGIQPGNSSSLRKESIGINMALSTLGDDPKATIAVLEAKVLELEEELRNSKMVREHIYVSFYPPSLSLLSRFLSLSLLHFRIQEIPQKEAVYSLALCQRMGQAIAIAPTRVAEVQ